MVDTEPIKHHLTVMGDTEPIKHHLTVMGDTEPIQHYLTRMADTEPIQHYLTRMADTEPIQHYPVFDHSFDNHSQRWRHPPFYSKSIGGFPFPFSSSETEAFVRLCLTNFELRSPRLKIEVAWYVEFPN
ncbi:hypothetical protein CDAR_399101 [Caerostris darwini]|uniref:Uncharacterized protein n=1 Tax=Caerostris darwini TaxID=1538125 RepID=A0AAV4T2J4_9ARAC|nr:hypothetical protein CDAR_399101 [Caerostris darwini]